MGSICSFYKAKKLERCIGMMGLDNAGKTTTLYQLKYKRQIETLPTVGFNVESVQCGPLLLNIWDICGGKPKMRSLWQHYNKKTAGIIFVVDAADLQRLHLAVQEFRWLFRQPDLCKVPFLIYVNKQDKPNALSAKHLVSLLNLSGMKQPWTLQECCALHDVGLWEGLEQLQYMLLGRK